MATGFITKLGRPAEIARADDGCSMGRQRCGDRLARAELGWTCSTVVIDGAERRLLEVWSDEERADWDWNCSLFITGWDDRPIRGAEVVWTV